MAVHPGPEPAEDLMQVGYVGLLKAITNFDPAVCGSLAAYTRPCISGEVKRHFRDKRWQVGKNLPLDLVDGTAGEIRLRCTRAEFEQLEHALETRFMPATSGYDGHGYGRDQVGYWPYYGLAGGPTPRYRCVPSSGSSR